MNNMRFYIDILNEIAMTPDIAAKKGIPLGEPPLTDENLKDRLYHAAMYGWSKPQKGTEMRTKLDMYMNDDPDFYEKISTARPDWVTGEGNAHVGTKHWSKKTID